MTKDMQIEAHLRKSVIPGSNCEHDASNFLVPQRFDLAFKLLWLELRNYLPLYVDDIYDQHIKVITEFTENEYGNTNKNGVSNYRKQFCKLEKSILKGYEKNISIIPIDKDGILLNGAHRTSIAIKNGMRVHTVRCNYPNSNYNWRFFQSRGMREDYLDFAARTICENAEHIFIAMRWPIAGEVNDTEINKILPNIFYEKKIDATDNLLKYLLEVAYSEEPWINSKNGLNDKLNCVRSGKKNIRVYLFQCSSKNKVIELKKRVRDIFNLDKHSIHITDTNLEVQALSNIVFHQNTINFLNSGLLAEKTKSIETKLEILRNFSQKNPNLEFVIDRSFLLEIMGMREATDIDIITPKNESFESTNPVINNCSYAHLYHDKGENELIFNPDNHVILYGRKFIRPRLLLRYKVQRAEKKDLADIEFLQKKLTVKRYQNLVIRFKSRYRYRVYLLRRFIIRILDLLGIKDFIKDKIGKK